jgi:hypothetical protein
METDRRRAEIRVGELDREGDQALEEINGSIKACLIFLFEIAGRVGLERGGEEGRVSQRRRVFKGVAKARHGTTKR